jgi:CO/xanthine dehydrogenase Mo-binding subunit
MGLATFMHGAGFTGSGEDHLASVVAVEARADGRIRVLSSNTEIGQGTNTIFAQIAADTLGVPIETIDVVQPDTAVVPDSGPTVASRTCMVVGKLVETAAHHLRTELERVGVRSPAATDTFARGCADYVARFGPLRATARYQPPPGRRWNDDTYQGDAYGTYAWAVYVAEVSVDTATWEVRVDDFVAVQEVGKVINPVLATGQIEGGIAQAIGWALYEELVHDEDGRLLSGSFLDYAIPTADRVPPIDTVIVEVPAPDGPFGAKGIGEAPVIPGPAAIANAIHAATGVRLRELPMTPPRVWAALQR